MYIEDINIAEQMLKATRINKRGKREIRFEVNSNYFKAIENLIKGYRELDKKNTDILEKLITERMVTKVISENIKGYQEALENSIPKSKIKEKIEELDSIYQQEIKQQYNGRYYHQLSYAIQVLQELLEE